MLPKQFPDAIEAVGLRSVHVGVEFIGEAPRLACAGQFAKPGSAVDESRRRSRRAW